MNIKEEILANSHLPKHIAIIMDGNGRWATNKGVDRIYGHKEGVETVRRILEACGEIGISYLTLYTFSIENWNRPQKEIDFLMNLMIDAISNETENLIRNHVKVNLIGNKKDLPEDTSRKIDQLINLTASGDGLELFLAISYSSRWEITEAAKKIALEYKEGKILSLDMISQSNFSYYLTTKNTPDPDLIIRTGGEIRLSNFLLWQAAYSELYFTEKYWPDFQKEDLYLAIRDYQNRERRFGKTGQQIKK